MNLWRKTANMKLTISNLEKFYGKNKVLKGLNIEINEGMFGLLGPNGAGKTTFMRILASLVSKSSGDIKFDNIDIENKKQVRKIIGYLPQDFSIYPSLSVYEAMDYLGLLSGMNNKNFRKKRIDFLLEKVNLQNNKKTKIKALSGGMKRRLGIAQAILHDPKVLIVDEPTAGLDPEERIRFRNLLRDFSNGRIVILSTHIVEDVEFTCENLAILSSGQFLYKGSVNALLENANGYIWTADIDKSRLDSIRDKYTIISAFSNGPLIKIKLIAKSKPFENAKPAKPSIEDAYMKLIKEV